MKKNIINKNRSDSRWSEYKKVFYDDKIFGILTTLMINIVSIAATITILFLNKDNLILIIIFLTLLVVLAFVAIRYLFHIACIELKYHHDNYNNAVANYELSKALPETFIFRNREDIFEVGDDGGATLTWNFEIEKITNNNLSFISLPVVCEYVENQDLDNDEPIDLEEAGNVDNKKYEESKDLDDRKPINSSEASNKDNKEQSLKSEQRDNSTIEDEEPEVTSIDLNKKVGDGNRENDFTETIKDNNEESSDNLEKHIQYIEENVSKIEEHVRKIEEHVEMTSEIDKKKKKGCQNKISTNNREDQKIVEINSFSVNGISQTNYQYIHLSTDYNRNRPIEKGMIRIPLFTASRKGGIDNITLVVKFKDMFANWKKKEYIIVDIPYITKKISVKVKHVHEEDYDINVIDNYFDVREMYSDTFDAGEVAKQLNNCSIEHSVDRNDSKDLDYLLWESDFPKLGYRYMITFNFIDRKEKIQEP